MHEFKLTIKLDNKDYCDGCPCLDTENNLCQNYRVDTFLDCACDALGLFTRPDICKESEATK